MAELPSNTGRIDGDARVGDQSDPDAIGAPALEHVGDNIGPYHLLDVLGEGGFGVVFLAERRVGITRQVALKVVKPGMDSRAVIARFEQERQALAYLDHPNIAKIFDAGSTPLGRMYFVMELVKGLPLTTFANSRGLPVSDRLKLFAAVCHGVHHAHTKGMVHRDLKPSNILVAEAEGGWAPKVIDFGVVKALQASMSGRTVHTVGGQALGTPTYMSPEQADATASDVDERSDVYSLGVILFELLTGRLPFDEEALKQAPVAGLSRVLEVLPITPAGKVNPSLRGDVETVILKAMHKDRDRRYQSAAALAADVEHVMAGEAIDARRDSAMYVARTTVRKAARRDSWLIGLAAAAVSVLVMAYLGRLVLAHWTHLDIIHRGIVTWAASPFTKPPEMSNVQVIALTDAHTLTQVGAIVGIRDAQDDKPKTIRPVHAALLTKLVATSAKGAFFDFGLSSEGDHDELISEAVGLAEARNFPWAFGLSRWPMEEKPVIAVCLAGYPERLGCPGGALRGRELIVEMAMCRGLNDVTPSAIAVLLAQIRGAEAVRQRMRDERKELPEGERPSIPHFTTTLKEAEPGLQFSFWTYESASSTQHVSWGGVVIPLTSVGPTGKAEPGLNVRADDTMGTYEVPWPDPQMVARHTLDYADALKMGDAEFSAMVANKIVLVCDLRTIPEDVISLDGRPSVRGSMVLATALEQLCSRAGTTTPDVFTEAEVLLGAGLLGAVVGRRLQDRAVRRWLVLAVLGGGMLSASVVCYAVGIDWTPVPAFAGMVLASEVAAIGGKVLIGSGGTLAKELQT